VENPENIVVSGLMVREFGPNADGTIYGELARQVVARRGGPEYEWTRLRIQEFERLGLRVADG